MRFLRIFVTVYLSRGRDRQHKVHSPDGYTRTKCGGYGEYLRALPMLPDGSPVKAYDGRLIKSGNSHCGVIDMDVGTKDLQQCADSALRLRCEYLYAAGEYDSICYQL